MALGTVAPQQRTAVADDQLKQTLAKVLKHHPNEEIYVNFEFRAREATAYTDKGQVMARQQFVVQPYQFPVVKAEQARVEVEQTKSYIKLAAGGTTLTVGKWSGMIDYLDVDGQPMLVDRQSITPEFWRAPTDNDYGARLQQRFGAWKAPQLKLESCSVSDNSIVANLNMPDVKARLVLTYTLQSNGEVIVRQQFEPTGDVKDQWLFRYGMQLQMPAQYDKVKYLGRGPHENYIDRNSSEFIGRYEGKVADEYFPYVRPQESGNHTDVRWFTVTDGQRGLTFYAAAPIECSALPYLVSDLDAGARKEHAWGQHSGDLKERPLTQVHVQQRQMGLGCITSWGTWPLPEYRLPLKSYDFTFVIRPERTK